MSLEEEEKEQEPANVEAADAVEATAADSVEATAAVAEDVPDTAEATAENEQADIKKESPERISAERTATKKVIEEAPKTKKDDKKAKKKKNEAPEKKTNKKEQKKDKKKDKKKKSEQFEEQPPVYPVYAVGSFEEPEAVAAVEEETEAVAEETAAEVPVEQQEEATPFKEESDTETDTEQNAEIGGAEDIVYETDSDTSVLSSKVMKRPSVFEDNLPIDIEQRVDYEFELDISRYSDELEEEDSCMTLYDQQLKADKQHDAMFPEEISEERYPSDFLDNIGKVQSVAELSEIISEHIVVQRKDSIQGYFTDPLTGDFVRTIIAPETRRQTVKLEEAAVIQVEEKDEGSEDDELLALLEKEEVHVAAEKIQKKVSEEDVGYQAMFRIDGLQQKKQYEADLIMKAMEEQKRVMATFIREYVLDLVKNCVDKSEYIPRRVILKESIDPLKSFEFLFELSVGYVLKKDAVKTLEAKATDFYRRVRMFSAITPHNYAMSRIQIKKLREGTRNVDTLLSREAILSKITKENVEACTTELSEMREGCKEDVRRFENMMRKVILRDRREYERLPAVITRQLHLMKQLQQSIFKSRMSLLNKQHILAVMYQKEKSLENIGHGVVLRDYQALETDIITLQKKIEDRQAELEKKRVQFMCNIQINAHYRERLQMLRKHSENSKRLLEDKFDELAMLRSFLYKSKIEHELLRKAQIHANVLGGLLDMPALGFDYDKTMKELSIQNMRVDDLRDRLSMQEQRVIELEMIDDDDELE